MRLSARDIASHAGTKYTAANSLALRRRSGERAGERGVSWPKALLSPALSSLLEERESERAAQRFAPEPESNRGGSTVPSGSYFGHWITCSSATQLVLGTRGHQRRHAVSTRLSKGGRAVFGIT